MINKIKTHINKKYMTISVYVIITTLIIFVLACAIFQIQDVLKSISALLGGVARVMIPVIIGAVIAYIINPMVVFIEKALRKIKFLKFKNERKYRTVAVLLCITCIILAIILLFCIFIFSITNQISSINLDKIANVIAMYIKEFSASLKNIEGTLSDFHIQSKGLDQYANQLSASLTYWLTNFANNLVANTVNFSGYIINVLFGMIICIYILIDKHDLFAYGNKLLKAMFSEKAEKKIKGFCHDLDDIFSGYIKSTLLDALLMCVTLSLTLSIIGIKFGALIGIMAGLCHLIPYFGPIVAVGSTIIFGTLNAQYSQVLIAIIVLLIIQQIDANVVQPKLLSSSLSLKPLVVFISLIIGADIGGVIGMVLAVPVAAVIKLFLERYIEARISKKKLDSI